MMADIAALEALKGDAQAWNAWRNSRDSHAPIDLEGAAFRDRNLQGFNLSGDNMNLKGALLRAANLFGANMAQAHLEAADLRRTNLDRSRLDGAHLAGALLDSSTLRDVNAVGADLTEASLRVAVLTDTNLTDAKLDRADLTSADLSHANLTGSSLAGAVLTGATVSATTSLLRSSVYGARIDRFTLESLDNYGGLTKGQRMTMVISDPVATLRSYYSGVWQWIHLVALTVFVFPYLFFLVRQYLIARFAPEDPYSVTLAESLAWFIWTGGTGYALSSAFFLFVFGLTYNVLRGALLLKTKQLELQEQCSGLPADFSLSGTWGFLLRAANVMFFINLLIVAWHTWHFMQMRVPLTLQLTAAGIVEPTSRC